MALTECSNCGKTVSDKAFQCPHCGTGLISIYSNSGRNFRTTTSRLSDSNKILRLCLLGIFGTLLFDVLIVFLLPLLLPSELLKSGYIIIRVFIGLIVFSSIGVLLFKKNYLNNLKGKIGSITCMLIYAFYILNDIFYHIPNFGGSMITLQILFLVSIGLLLWDLKIHKSIKILGILCFVPSLILNLMLLNSNINEFSFGIATFILEIIRILLLLITVILICRPKSYSKIDTTSEE